MSHEISRMYATAADAHAAAGELREEGFDDVHVVTQPAGEVPVSAIAAQIAQGRVLLADARIYAERVAQGAALVTVHAPFGTGLLAQNILEAANPIPSGKPEPAPEKIWDEAAPFSSAMHMPLLLDDPAPASAVIGVRPLFGNDCSLSGLIGLPLLTRGEMGEGRWGLPYLSSKAAPLSSLLGLPLLRDSKRSAW